MHSGGMELIIELRYRKRSFRLEVREDGRGIDSSLLQSSIASKEDYVFTDTHIGLASSIIH